MMMVIVGIAARGGGRKTLSIREMRYTKVGDFDSTTVSCPEEIGGFDVSVDDTLIMN